MKYTENQLSIISKLRSVILCLTAHPDNEPDSEFADRIEDLFDIVDFTLLREFDKQNSTRKALGIQEARQLVNQMLSEEISFSRFVELINEGSKI